MTSTWPGWICLWLNEHGRPCNRATTKRAIAERYCALHRPVVEAAPRTRPGPSAAYQRARRARIARAGLSPAMEAA